MDLEIEEVSELLKVSSTVLLDWIEKGKIPAYRIKNRYRFNREEIENWLLHQHHSTTHITEQSNVRQRGQEQYNLYRAICKGGILTTITEDTKEKVFAAASLHIAPKLRLDPEILAEHLLERERLEPTAVGAGFAIPHTKDFLLCTQQDIVTIVFLPKPILYGKYQDLPVHTLFFLLSCNNRRHLSLLAKIAQLVQSETMQQLCNKRPSEKQLLMHIKDWETHLILNVKNRDTKW